MRVEVDGKGMRELAKGATSQRGRAGHAHPRGWCGEVHPGEGGKGSGPTERKILGYPLFPNGVARH